MRQSRTIEMLAPCGMFLQFPQAQQNDAPISAQVLVIPALAVPQEATICTAQTFCEIVYSSGFASEFANLQFMNQMFVLLDKKGCPLR